MNTNILEKVETAQLKKRPDVKVGDTVKLSMKIKEGGKERIQVFEGIVIAKSGSGMSKTITVRKMSYGVGVERIVPFHSPTLDKIEIVKRGIVRRAKLYYMRGKIGKRAMDVINAEDVYMTDQVEVPAEEVAASVEEAAKETKEEAVVKPE